MARKSKFLLVSLKEEGSKKLAQVIGNDTCRKILDFMSEKDSVTETDISQSLKLNASTVHYNLGHLKKAQLIESEDFHYSEKGREVHHWRLVNKYIIIAPGKIWGLKEKLKNILPVLGVAGGVAIGMQLFAGGFGGGLFGRTLAQQVVLQKEMVVASLPAGEALPLARAPSAEAVTDSDIPLAPPASLPESVYVEEAEGLYVGSEDVEPAGAYVPSSASASDVEAGYGSQSAGSYDYNQYLKEEPDAAITLDEDSTIEAVVQTVTSVAEPVSQAVIADSVVASVSYAGIGISFFLGACMAVGLYLLFDYLRHRK